jgi:OOP family OmpA-OmpF porin
VERDTVAFVDSTKEESFMMVALPNVQFYTDQAILLPSSSKELVTVAEYMTNNPEATAEIYGHTDSVGNDQHNMQLSQRRAEAVKNFLSSLGVEPNRITATGFGETRPKASNGTPEGRLMNRRVEMKLTQPKKVTKSRTQVSPDSIKQSTP